MKLKLFIAGTDTGIGKTYISTGILSAFNERGYSTLGIKPVASGCKRINEKLFSEDSMMHLEHSSLKLSHDEITPFAYEPPIAPHIAAQLAGSSLSVANINERLQLALTSNADVTVIEGCGGWYVPLNDLETMADFVLSHSFKVILVVGIRLGCLNHALLTYRAMQEEGANVAGWIANCIDPAMINREENIATLKEWLPVPCLDVINYEGKIDLSSMMKMIKPAVSA